MNLLAKNRHVFKNNSYFGHKSKKFKKKYNFLITKLSNVFLAQFFLEDPYNLSGTFKDLKIIIIKLILVSKSINLNRWSSVLNFFGLAKEYHILRDRGLSNVCPLILSLILLNQITHTI